MQAHAGIARDEGPQADAGVLDHMTAVFGLNDVARGVVEQLLLGVLSGPREPAPRVRTLIAPWLERGMIGPALSALEPGAPLSRYGLVSTRGDGPWLDRRVALADDFWPRLLGHWPRDLQRARVPRPEVLAGLVLDAAVRSAAERACAGLQSGVQQVFVRGRRGSGRLTLARALSWAARFPTLEASGAALAAGTVRLLAREARWQRALLIIEDVDAVAPEQLDELAAHTVRFVATCGPGFARGLQAAGQAIAVDLAMPSAAQRVTLWQRALEGAGADTTQLDLTQLSRRFALGPGQIDATVRRLMLGSPQVTQASASAACRDLAQVEAEGLAQRLPLEHTLGDLIVPTAVRRDLELITTWGRRGAKLFPNQAALARPGLICLFHGPSGTGKTLAAQVIARELEIDLYRVDLAQLVDKYIGETEKRLDRVLSAAEASGAALLFDEADALFSRRAEVKDARDRYANLETGYLLQRVESHAGLCFLSSNLPHSIDGAFHRRFAFMVEFPRPALEERRALWARLLELLAPAGAPDLDLEFLADRFPLSGGDIRNAIFAASLLAARDDAPLSMRHLVIAGFRELVKSGRLVDGRLLEPWHGEILRYLGPGQAS